MRQAAAVFLICWVGCASACIPVTGSHILAGQLAQADRVFSALPAEKPLLLAPRAGVERHLLAGDIRKLAARNGIESHAESGACFAWPMTELEAQSVHAAVKDVLSGTSVEVLEVSRTRRPPGTLVFDRRGLSAVDNTSGVFLWRGSVRYEGLQSFPVWARVRLGVRTGCAVATEIIGAGTVIADAQVRSADESLSPRVALDCVNTGAAVGKVARRLLRAGQVVRNGDLEAAPAITPGDAVSVDVYHGLAHLSFTAKAESRAGEGEQLFLRNPRSGKRFAARVTGPRKAEVRGGSE